VKSQLLEQLVQQVLRAQQALRQALVRLAIRVTRVRPVSLAMQVQRAQREQQERKARLLAQLAIRELLAPPLSLLVRRGAQARLVQLVQRAPLQDLPVILDLLALPEPLVRLRGPPEVLGRLEVPEATAQLQGLLATLERQEARAQLPARVEIPDPLAPPEIRARSLDLLEIQGLLALLAPREQIAQ
jgi:hypothetical protein